jgi:hypothetical protein
MRCVTADAAVSWISLICAKSESVCSVLPNLSAGYKLDTISVKKKKEEKVPHPISSPRMQLIPNRRQYAPCRETMHIPL